MSMDSNTPKIYPGSVCRVPYSLAGFGGALVKDWVDGKPSAQQFFPPRTWREVVQEVATQKYPRVELAAILESSGRELGAPEASLANARLLSADSTYAVVTGQQAGLLGGPLLTLHKALTAIKLARQYESEANGSARFVPVFWVAGDDHDVGEIDHAYFLRDDGNVTRVRAPIIDADHGRSASDLFISQDPALWNPMCDELEQLLGVDFAARSLSHYATKSFESAFATLLLQWLGPLGLVVARSSDMRRFSPALLSQNLGDYREVAALIQSAGDAMQASGYEPGFSGKLRIAPHFFMAEKSNAARGSIHVDPDAQGDFFHVHGESDRALSIAEMRDAIARAPELCTPSAPLRPILQQSIFPVVAAILGPGEMAYWAQLVKVHTQYKVAWPVIVPRASLTLIDPAGEKAVRKLDLVDDPTALFLNKEELTHRAVGGGEAAKKIAARTAAILSEFDAMRAEINAAGGGVDPMLEKLREKFTYELARVAEKTNAALDKSSEAKATRAAYLSGLVLPKNAPQERTLGCAHFLAKFDNLPARLLEVIDPDCREHLIVTLS